MFKDKTLLVTGGTGSFGNAVIKRFINSDISEIRVFSRDEKKQDDMRKLYSNNKIKFYIGDVRSKSSIQNAMYGVDYVFHAAALKQVPSCEFFPMEAVNTNIIGTSNTIDAAQAVGVSKMICLSTDKAVYPINAMGTSKAMMERVAIGKSRAIDPTKMILCATRYGNVMASRGSVIPLFIRQIKNNDPITITDPEMTRYMMTLEHAVDLVLFAFNNAESGDILVQKSPAATVKILAEALMEIYDKPNHPIEILGTRHGEKKHETLLSREEMAKAKDLDEYYRVPADKRDLNYGNYVEVGETKITDYDDYTSHNTRQLNKNEMIQLLKELPIIQEYLK